LRGRWAQPVRRLGWWVSFRLADYSLRASCFPFLQTHFVASDLSGLRLDILLHSLLGGYGKITSR